MRATSLAALLGALAVPLAAQEAVPCDEHWAGGLENLAEPLEDNTRAFAEGQVRVLILAAPDPACCGAFPAVLLPEVEGFRVCRLVPGKGGDGWGGLAFEGPASYDPAQGLVVPMLASVWTGEGFDRRPVALTVNQATGRVAVAPR